MHSEDKFCLEYYNLDTRTAPFRNEHTTITPKPRDLETSKMTPRPPPRRFPPVQSPIPTPRNLDYYYTPPYARQNYQPFFQNRAQTQQIIQPPPRPFYPKPQPRPEPMDIDYSIRTRNLNYGNRPQNDTTRSVPKPNHMPFKQQAHPIDTSPEMQAEQFYNYGHDTAQTFDPYTQYDEYYQHYEFPNDSEEQAGNEQIPAT